MQADWIKMRTDLYRDPKVICMADFLMQPDSELACYVNQHCQCNMAVTRNVTRCATVGALVAVWGIGRQRGERNGDDLVLPGAALATLDDVSELQGFGEAMASVGWAEESTQGVVFPGFFATHNVDPREAQRERQRRYRERRKATKSDVTRDVTRDDREREEKRREERKEEPPISPKGDSAFDAFWRVVHLKTGRRAAEIAFGRAVKRAAAEKAITGPEAAVFICERMAEFAKSSRARPADHSPIHPATWLNQGCYDDDPKAWEKPNGQPQSPARIAAPPGKYDRFD